MTAQRETLLCRYQYDPLDRVVGCTPLNRDSVQRFYRKNRLATEIQGQVQHSVFEHEAQPLAQRRFEADSVDCALLATDLQRSVLQSIAVGQHQQPVYSPYGHRSPEGGLISLLGFNGERRDPVTGHYLLGNGYRAFNPALMRFNSPDSLSPFGKGGVNAYAYCGGDPVNWVDPMGEFALFARGISRLVSVSISAGQEAGKGLRVMKNAVITRFSKAPTLAESGRESVLKATPKTHATKVTEAMAKADESKIYQAGAEYRHAAKKLAQQETRSAKFQRFADANQFPDEIKYKELEKYRSDFQQAEQQLATVAREHVLKYPGELMPTNSLIGLIRGK
ncbi:RHS repeat-associated core domain-containing protein [Pseudomonas sp. TH41]|uniref:RHS repeat-associated core domain-containing protein n=1 Tax=Pseudomonas sp. TH41 TaxID=2796405 RepID=UPI0019131380|nr:RHS repeat-associated core domain-containing protein [Pseudomonas sp. TH41]MBK5355161.1 RHS repeat-associated core domain-containing protein [Pseudomonas sp. TH41]